MKYQKKIAIVRGVRTPFVKANAEFREFSSLDLAVHSVKGLIQRVTIDPAEIGHLAYGTVIPDPKIPQLAREIVFASGLPDSLPAHSVSNNCITGIQAITDIANLIELGEIGVGIAGGTESMSNPPILFTRKMAPFLMELQRAKTFSQKLKILLKLRPSYFKPHAPSIAEPSTGLTMGQHCEIMAKEWHVNRSEQDEIALKSHQNAAAATLDGRLTAEIAPLKNISYDTIVRKDTTLEQLQKLKPVFDRSADGTITAGNSSPLTDGASSVLLCDAETAHRLNLEPLAYIKAYYYAAINPAKGLLMAPAIAVPKLLAEAGLTLADMDLIEMHEAFAAQVLCNIRAWQQGWIEPAIGQVDMAKLNVCGSSIAIGHPFAATGGRIVTTLAHEMQRRNAKYGLISICAAGAMAAAMILERP